MSKKEPFSLFKVVAENLSSNELGLKTKLKEQKEFSENKIKEFEIGKIYYGVSIGDSDLKSYYKIIARSSKQVTIQEVDETGYDKKREGEKRVGINIYDNREIFYPDGKYSMALSISADREYSLKKENPYNESNKLVSEKIKERIKDFHYYLENGFSLDEARKKIFDSTTYSEVKQYVNDYVAANNNFSLQEKIHKLHKLTIVEKNSRKSFTILNL
ncbi:MAG: hypothetical protein IPL26_00140 [Leptospiraceae bacterium]|nr:hypothetical protein [Leptospiraceae bacterium]